MGFFREIRDFLRVGTDSMQETPFLILESEEELQAALERSEQEPIVIYKHSQACGVSSLIRRRLMALTTPSDPPIYELVVQISRQLSNKLAGIFDIKHESPQVIVVYHNKAIFNTSHGRITANIVRDAALETL